MNNKLTKREKIAAFCMTGIITAHPEQLHNYNENAHHAIKMADALIHNLGTEPPKEKSPDLEHFDKMRLNEVTQKLDKIWGHVPSEVTTDMMDVAWTASKAREETKKLLTEYFL